jgi:hypothetical protein
LNKNMFEFALKDDFLPIYTHAQYFKIFKDTSMAMEMSPNRRSTAGKQSTLSPARGSTTSKMMQSTSSIGSSPLKFGKYLDLHKKTGVELRESPSKAAKIVMRYINNYADVGPVIANQPVTHQNLIEMAKTLDKKELWIKSDLRLIFAVDDTQTCDEIIEQLNKIITAE